ncbi:MAG: saccharopine dehydrogenase C-terminal domain-containing protein [Planctomycetota bacterium]
MTKIVLLGAGKVGKLICTLLTQNPDYEITVGDYNAETLKHLVGDLKGKNVTSSVVDVTKENELLKLFKGKEMVLSACPYFCNKLIAKCAKESNIHYLDLTEDVETTEYIQELAKNSSKIFCPQCGLAPGFISIVTNQLIQEFDEIETVKMRVGALPTFPSNCLKYNLTWSTEGLINEYGNPCDAIMSGKKMKVLPLEGLEQFVLDGNEYEAFNTSGGLGTLCDKLLGRVKELNYKSIRYPGHRNLIYFLMNDLKLNEDRPTLKRIFENAIPTTVQDKVIIFVVVSGKIRGSYVEKDYVNQIYSQKIDGKDWSALQITTASSACTVIDLIANKKLKKKGFVNQEDITLELFLQNSFSQCYRQNQTV